MLNPTSQPDFTSDSSVTDRDLLRRFVQDSDESAFTEIVRRHQGLVLGVCRRVLNNSADVDDAFQATFIALARRPRHVRSATSLSSWLYTVAWRTSWRVVKQRRTNPVESLTSNPAEEHPGPLDQIATAQECVVLDEELNHLPAKYRDVLVMTYFASQTSQQIADQLNVSKGTIDGRVRQARNMLRVRLARRGVAIGAIAVAAGMSTGPTALASPELFDATVQLGAQTLSGSVPGTTDLSVLEPFIKQELTMLNSKLVLSTLLATTAVAGIAGMTGLGAGEGDKSSSDSPQTLQAEVASVDDSAEILEGAIPVSVVTVAAKAEPDESIVQDVAIDRTAGNSVMGAARYKPYADGASAKERWMYSVLDESIPLLDYPGEVPLSEVLDEIESFVTNTHGKTADGEFRLPIYPDTVELFNEGVSDLEDVTVTDVSLQNTSLKNALKLIFEKTVEPELTYMIEDDVMKITTRAKMESDAVLTLRIYDVAGLVELDYGRFGEAPQISDDVSGPGGGFFSIPALSRDEDESQIEESRDEDEVIDVNSQGFALQHPLASLVVEMTTPPLNWVVIGDGEGGSVRLVGTSLIVRQTPNGHQMVVELLNKLHRSLQSSQK